jgi:O-antigen/teichoic acid export membrane protein
MRLRVEWLGWVPIVRSLVEAFMKRRAGLWPVSSNDRVLAVLGGQLLTLMVLVAGTRLLTELVDGDVFGEARLAVGVAALVGATVVHPFSQFAMRGYHDAAVTGSALEFARFARRGNTAAAVSSALLAAGLWVGYEAWAREVNWFLAAAVGAYVFGEARWSLERSLLVTRDRQAAASAVEVAMQVLLVGAAVAAVVLTGDHAVGLVGGQASALLAVGAWLARVTREAPDGTFAELRASKEGGSTWHAESVRFVAPLTMVSMARWMVNVGDRYLLDHMRGPRAVGHYAAVYGLCSAPLMACSGIVARLLYSTWFEREARGGRDDDLFSRMLAAATTIAGIALLATWAFGDVVASVVLAVEYRAQAQDLMVWIVAGYGLLVVAAPFEMRAYARKTTWVLGTGWSAAALANLVLNLAWIPMWGPVGAARATLVSFAVYLVVLWWGTGLRSRAGAVPARQRV